MNVTNSDGTETGDLDQRDSDKAAAAERVRHAAHERIDTVAEAVHPVVDRLTDAAHKTVEKLSNAATHAAESVSVKTDDLQHLQDQFTEDCREFVRTHPLKSLGYAAAVGFILTKLLRA